MRIREVITKEKCVDIQANSHNWYRERCEEHFSKENMYFDTGSKRVKVPLFFGQPDEIPQ